MTHSTQLFRRSVPATLMTLALLLLFAAATQAQQAEQPQQAGLIPIHYCHDPVYTGGTLTAYRHYFGYDNRTGTTFSHEDGSSNYFTPNPGLQYSGKQVTNFQLGYHPKVFFIDIAPNAYTSWVLRTNAVSTVVNPSKQCSVVENLTPVTYQGKLTVSGAAVNQPHDFIFRFFKHKTEGTPLGTVELPNVPISNGIFNVQLDIDRIIVANPEASNVPVTFMEISVRPTGTTDSYQSLTPRQQLTSAPFALNARNVSGGFVQVPHVSSPHGDQCHARTVGEIRASHNGIYVCVPNSHLNSNTFRWKYANFDN